MPTPGPQIRRCIVEREYGPITVRLAAHHMLQAGAEFLLIDAGGTVRDTWRLATGADGAEAKVLPFGVDSLHQCRLTWEILVCVFSKQADAGVVEVSVLQQGIPCALTKDAKWALQSVPTCESNHAIPINASLEIIVP